MSSIGPFDSVPPTLAGPVRTALRVLLLAGDYAEKVHQDPWDFAVEVAVLQVLVTTA